MILSKLVIVNYRSCRYMELDTWKDEPNIFIGVNDSGKTTILKALGLLLDDKPQFYFVKDTSSKRDLSNTPIAEHILFDKLLELGLPPLPYTETEAIVFGKFTIEEGDLADELTSNWNNQLLWALENSIRTGLWFCRIFDTKAAKIKQFILLPDALNFDNQLEALYGLTDAKLQKKRSEYGVTPEDIQNENGYGRFTKLEILRAVYKKMATEDHWVEVKLDKDFFPIFKYLDWNSSFDNILETAAGALANLIDVFLSPVKSAASKHASKAEKAVNEKLGQVQGVISSILPQVTSLKAKIQFDVKEKITDLIINKLQADGDIHMDLQGDGVKRQIWFAIVKAAAQGNDSPVIRKRHLWAFDEPETHLYPTAQRQLFEIIKEISQSTIQSLISTHSTVFIDRANLDAIKIVCQGINGYSEHSNCTTVDAVFRSLELRNSDFLFYDKFLVVEGKTEQYLIPALYKLYSGKTLLEDNIQLVVLHSASKWIDQKKALESVLDGFKKSTEQVVYLFDYDQSFEISNTKREPNMFFVGKQDMEDAIPSSVWTKAVNSLSPELAEVPEEAIEGLKLGIPHTVKIPSHDKFLAKISKQLNRRLVDMKGQELAELLIKFMDLTTIPEIILNCFKMLSTSPLRPESSPAENDSFPTNMESPINKVPHIDMSEALNAANEKRDSAS